MSVMRFWILIVLSGVAFGQQVSPTGCNYAKEYPWKGFEEYEYQKSVLQLIHPEERSLVSVAVFVTGEAPVMFLRMVNSARFEITSAQLITPVHDSISGMAAACKLPVSPYDTAKMLKVNWQRRNLSRSEFQKLYDAFTTALSEYANDVKRRNAMSGDQIDIHGHEFTISYESAGFEHFTITALDSHDPNGKLQDPIASWAVKFLASSKELLSQ